VLLSLVVLLFPGRAASTEDGDTDEIDLATRAATRSTFSLYVVALLALAAGAAFGGYVVTVIAVSLLVLRFAERRRGRMRSCTAWPAR
jgi:hypothetical protein